MAGDIFGQTENNGKRRRHGLMLRAAAKIKLQQNKATTALRSLFLSKRYRGGAISSSMASRICRNEHENNMS